ncbi:MAG: hypothetical protein JWP09_572 [Candidatus Taylorbacteria bacterium]|nr:hypothetical protein [Candidatus Taylorbacteria bacterium]
MIYAKKSLGQNFLKSGSALRAIIVAGDIKPTDIILEIGPGKGALTAKILETGAKMIAVEKDRDLIPYLETKFATEIKSKQLTLMEGDILELNAKQILGKITSYKLIANIPYYITGEIIRKYFEEKIQPEKMVLLVQKEVALRIVARDGKASILSIACKAYSTPRYVQTVKRDAFNPAPNVDSAIIAFENINKDLFKKDKASEGRFFEVMKLGFAHKRKKIGGNLKEIATTLNPLKLEQIKDKRSENLIVTDWVELIQK